MALCGCRVEALRPKATTGLIQVQIMPELLGSGRKERDAFDALHCTSQLVWLEAALLTGCEARMAIVPSGLRSSEISGWLKLKGRVAEAILVEVVP
jgi:hypothetical protein